MQKKTTKKIGKQKYRKEPVCNTEKADSFANAPTVTTDQTDLRSEHFGKKGVHSSEKSERKSQGKKRKTIAHKEGSTTSIKKNRQDISDNMTMQRSNKSAKNEVKSKHFSRKLSSKKASEHVSMSAQKKRAIRNSSEQTVEADDKLTESRDVKIAKALKHPKKKSEIASDSSESEWEEVEELEHIALAEAVKPVIPQKSEPLQITMDADEEKKTKKKYTMESFFKTLWNRLAKDIRTNIHQVHLLCLVAHAVHCNIVCNSPELQALALSLVPHCYSIEPMDQKLVLKFVNWFKLFITLEKDEYEIASAAEQDNLEHQLIKGLHQRKVQQLKNYIMLVAVCLRSLSVLTRLVFNLQPSPLKPPSQKSKSQDKHSKGISKGKSSKSSSQKSTNPAETAKTVSQPKTGKSCDKSKTAGTTRQSKRSQNMDYRESETDSEYSPDEEDDESDGGFGRSRRKRKSQHFQKKLKLTKPITKSKDVSNDNGASTSKLDRNLSLVCQGAEPKDLWLEIYIKATNRWIPIDCTSGPVNNIRSIEETATKPVHYVLGIDNDGCIRDVTSRYASDWLTQTHKLRTDERWWEETLAPYKSDDLFREKEEELQLKDQLIEKPMPTSIQAFKNNQLYALKRHLLKFEDIYPRTAQVLGTIRGEPIYARECVRTLHSRETWLKEARSIKEGEVPYKMVKPRPKPGKPKGEPLEATLQLYGKWQTEPYKPPPIENGKIPRNRYGNVELFKPCMLPEGAVHLRLPGLNRIAQKLNVDCVPAMIGWDFHGGWNHAVLDGYIVCAEHADSLREAWEAEQEEVERRQKQKRQKKAIANWRLLTRGLLIRERLRNRYDLQKPKPVNTEEGEKAKDVDSSWPRNRGLVKQLETYSEQL